MSYKLFTEPLYDLTDEELYVAILQDMYTRQFELGEEYIYLVDLMREIIDPADYIRVKEILYGEYLSKFIVRYTDPDTEFVCLIIKNNKENLETVKDIIW